MKKSLLFLFVLTIFLFNEMNAQYTFVVSRKDKSGISNNLEIYEGELFHSKQVSIDEFDELDSEGERQLHMKLGLNSLSFLSDTKLNFDKYYYSPDETYYPPFKENLEIDSDIIKEGIVFEVIASEKSIKRQKIKKGFVRIRYELNPKRMTVYFYDLKLVPAKKAFIRKT